jgi:hypothetical protein
MKASSRSVKVHVAFLALAFIWVLPASPLAQDKKAEQDLRITFGGFVENHPEGGQLGGVCGTDTTRNVLNCDIYNGLLEWTVTEITLAVTWSPYRDDDKRYYRVRLSIESLKTERVSVRLGLQLPPDDVVGTRTMKHWAWLIAGARGTPR